jgi:ribosome biogenesis protein MAK21
MKATMPKVAGDDDISDLDDDSDSDDMPSDLDMDSDGDAVDIDGASDEGRSSDPEAESSEIDDDDALSLVENSDNDDLRSLDADAPDGLVAWDGDSDDPSEVGVAVEEEDEEWGGVKEGEVGNKRKRGSQDETAAKGKRKKLRNLPTFASYEDYAKMIEDGPEDFI